MEFCACVCARVCVHGDRMQGVRAHVDLIPNCPIPFGHLSLSRLVLPYFLLLVYILYLLLISILLV